MTPRRSALPRQVATRLAATEYARCAALLGSVELAEWATPTECPQWNVRQMAAHMLGMVEMAASARDGSRQRHKAARAGGVFIDALTAIQVAEHADWPGSRIAQRFAARWPKAQAGRRRTPGLIRRRTMPGGMINGIDEPWTLGYLLDVILTRDPWMHRMDISAATDREPELTADHDGLLIADVVAEWAGRHGKDFTLRLTGPAGGHWTTGTGGPVIEMDAVAFCRVLSHRRGPVSLEQLLGTEVPF
ncbi:MAG TPA: maleylpyruvate isomerase family mycothiol-dependent enzyme [Streptosporangiaceae bacterium]